MDGKKITIFTPTYNRANLLPRVYNSLLEQNSDVFTWLIIDDGSTDNTKEVVDRFISENKIPIRYVFCQNGGKMRAHNRAVEMADTELFLCLDSDDWLNKGAVNSLVSKWENVKSEELAGIISHKGKSETELLSGVEFPENIEKSTLFSLYMNGFKGETTLLFRTKVIREFPFPEIEGEKYVPEDYIYDKIDKKYTYYVLPEIITICELMENGYTDSVKELKHNNKEAFYLLYEQRANITPLSVLKIKYCGFCARYAKLTGRKLSEIQLPIIYTLLGKIASGFIKE